MKSCGGILVVDDPKSKDFYAHLPLALDQNENKKNAPASDLIPLIFASNGEDAFQHMPLDALPRLILLSLSLADFNGFEFCKSLKADEHRRDIPIIFVTHTDSVEEVIKGYDAGGQDYVCKPFDSELLARKVHVALNLARSQKTSEQAVDDANASALSAVLESGEQAVVIHFLRKSFHARSCADLADMILRASDDYGLKSSVLIQTELEQVVVCNSEPIPVLERALLERLGETDIRIHQSDRRLLLNFGHVVQIVRNLPDDRDMQGRLRDNLALILEGANSRCEILQKSQQLNQLVSDSQASLQKIHDEASQHKERNLHIVDELTREIEQSFSFFGMAEAQEKKLLAIVQRAVDQSLKATEQRYSIDKELGQIVEELRSVASFDETSLLEEPLFEDDMFMEF